jgi:hypothetical protein
MQDPYVKVCPGCGAQNNISAEICAGCASPLVVGSINTAFVRWRTFGLLLAASLITSFFVLPYSFTLTSSGKNTSSLITVRPLLVMVVLTVISTLVTSGIAIAIGLWLGNQIGLGAPIIQAWVIGDPEASRRFRAELPIAFWGSGLRSV